MKDGGQRVSDEGQTVNGALNGRGRLPDGLWAPDDRAFDDFASSDERFGGDVYPGLVSLGFIQAAIRRTARMWCALGIVGLLAGVGLFVLRPAGYQATTQLLLAQPPGAPVGWITDDQAIAQSRTVAGIALRKLGLQADTASFVKVYTVATVTDRVLQITVKAQSARDALREANALAAAFLTFQKHLLDKQEQLVSSALQEQIGAARHQLAVINAEITSTSPSRQDQLHSLQIQRAGATSSLTQLKLTVANSQANAQAATTTAVNDSGVLDPAGLVKQSVKRRMALYGGGGLLAGLVLGLGIVVLRAVVSNRLRRRDDVARALGAPVRLSIGKRHLSRRRLRRQGLAAAQSASLSRVVIHLGTAVAPTSGGFASLAVVPADDIEVAAVCLAALAMSSAQQGLRVVLADLCDGAPGARLLGVTDPGVGEVSVGHAGLVVVVPDREDVLPRGPLDIGGYGPAGDDPLAAACASAELVLTLAALDPAMGGDFLAEWATSVVAFVTTGQSSAERVHAVGEMIRLAGIQQVSAVLVGADKADESLGLSGTEGAERARFSASGSPAGPDVRPGRRMREPGFPRP